MQKKFSWRIFKQKFLGPVIQGARSDLSGRPIGLTKNDGHTTDAQTAKFTRHFRDGAQ
jgi:hypothetical protein